MTRGSTVFTAAWSGDSEAIPGLPDGVAGSTAKELSLRGSVQFALNCVAVCERSL